MPSQVRKGLFLAIVVVLGVGVCSAQFSLRGSISGTVTDTSQAVVPGANVTLTDIDRNQSVKTTTNATGQFTFTQLTIGHYRLKVEETGFSTTQSPVLRLETGQNVRFDVALQLGAVNEVVNVDARTPLLEADQGFVGVSVDRETLDSLPAKGRNFTDYALLAPNIYSFANNGSNGGVNYIAGGGGDNGMYLNGVYTNTSWGGTTGTTFSPSIEALGEVRVSTFEFSAASGRDVSTFQAFTKGGTNQYHGEGFENFENGALNAWNAYTKITTPPGTRKAVLQKNRFGGNFGGPIWIPKIFRGKDRLFFFVNYEQLHQNSFGSLTTARVPTAAERQGDFSAVLQRFNGSSQYQLWNPFSTTIDAKGNSRRTPVPNNILSSVAPVNPSAQGVLSLLPMPNGYYNPANPNSLSNFATLTATRTNRYEGDLRR